MRSPTCVHCGSPSHPYFRAPRLGTFFRCSQCRWTFQDPDAFESEETWQAAATSQRNDQLFRRVFGETIDTSDAQGDMYPEFGIEQHRLASGVFARMRAAIQRHTDLQSDSAFSVLDIGCATGFLLNEFRRHYQHAQLMGIDPSQVSTAKARELYGLEVHTDTLNSHAFGNRRFDVITIMGNLQLHD
ncbi:MAG: class I SAM-dependent methyltransferase, partial [Planctomycetota bacterium]